MARGTVASARAGRPANSSNSRVVAPLPASHALPSLAYTS